MDDEIRVKIRNHGDDSGKLMRFHKSIHLYPLIMKIAHKLKEDMSGFDVSQHQLFVAGQFLVESVSEIDDGDELVLKRIHETTESNTVSATATAATPAKKEEEELSADQVPIKQEPQHSSGEVISFLDDEENPVVTPDSNTSQSNEAEGRGGRTAGVKREAPPIRRAKKKKPEIITIDDESDVDGDDDSSSDGSIEDGSDAWMSSEEEEEDEESDEEEESDFEPESDDEFEADDVSEDKAEMKKVKANTFSRVKEAPLQVLMNEKDVPSAPGKREGKNEDDQEEEEEEEVSLLVNGAGRQKADKAVKDRIMKLLNTGFHDQSNEHEAKNAMKLAQRLMRKHNLSQALLLKERDAKNNGNQTSEVLRGGMVHVQIINRRTQKPALFARWLSSLAYHVGKNFDVKSYHTVRRGRKCEVTFYGIYTNAQLAGYAFRVAAERISQMGATYEPKRRTNNISLASCRLSYCIGIVKGIGDEVQRNIREEKLKRLRKLERARIAVSNGEAYEESDDDEGSDNLDNDGPGYAFADPVASGGTSGDDRKSSATETTVKQNQTGGNQNDQSISLVVSSSETKPPVLSGKALDDRLRELENENQAALTLVDHRQKVAEDVLKDNGVKLSSGRRHARMNFDGKSYRQGIEDSKEVDLNQRAIRDEVKVKREKGR